MIRKSAQNWVSITLILIPIYFRFYSGKRNVKIKFRNGNEIVLASYRLALTVLVYYYISNAYEIYSYAEMKQIKELSVLLEQKLRKKFNKDQIDFYKLTDASAFSPTTVAIYCIIRKHVPQIMVETGVANGFSTSLFLKALSNNGTGKLISIDFPTRSPDGYSYDNKDDRSYTPLDLEPGWLVPDELRYLWELKVGKSVDILPMLDEVEIFYHDSEHSYNNMMFEYEWAFQHLRKGGILASDDISWNDAWDDFLIGHTDLSRFLNDRSLGIAVKQI